jgi:hypothetical protein
MPIKPLAMAPGPLQMCDSPRSDISMRALIQAEVILCMRC